jgi:hypothetical protein
MTAEKDEISVGLITLVGVSFALLLFVIFTATQAWYYNLQNTEYYYKVITQKPAELTNLVSEQQAQINSYKWVDQKNQVVQIPIEQAMALVSSGKGIYPLPTPTPPPAATSTIDSATGEAQNQQLEQGVDQTSSERISSASGQVPETGVTAQQQAMDAQPETIQPQDTQPQSATQEISPSTSTSEDPLWYPYGVAPFRN